MAFTSQTAFDVRCEWGSNGVEALADCRTFIIVDVLSFSTCVGVAITASAMVFPYRYNDDTAPEFALRHRAVLAGRRGSGYSLSPGSLLTVPSGTRLVLPSPNGATISLVAARHGHVLVGCLRNRSAVCSRAVALEGPFAVIPAGERWEDGSLRPALEDLVGAGAIAAMLPGTRSPEAETAIAAFEAISNRLPAALESCASGLELVERGFSEDVQLASSLDVEFVAPELIGEAFVGGPATLSSR